MTPNEIVKKWMLFGYNYPTPEKFISYICAKTGKDCLKDHLMNKFHHYYSAHGSYAVMNLFYSDLDADLREALVDYAMNVVKG